MMHNMQFINSSVCLTGIILARTT